ncbi:MAG: hypothetical protein ACFFEM_02565 [Candidatus Thorarchaeota archaeon]
MRSVVAGANIIDGAIIVIAADEGPMVQTGEHIVMNAAIGASKNDVETATTKLYKEASK